MLDLSQSRKLFTTSHLRLIQQAGCFGGNSSAARHQVGHTTIKLGRAFYPPPPADNLQPVLPATQELAYEARQVREQFYDSVKFCLHSAVRIVQLWLFRIGYIDGLARLVGDHTQLLSVLQTSPTTGPTVLIPG